MVPNLLNKHKRETMSMRKTIVSIGVVLAATFVWTAGAWGETEGFAVVEQAVTTLNCMGSDVAVHSLTGDMVVCGYFAGAMRYGPGMLDAGDDGGADIYLLRLDGVGRLLWSRQAGGTGDQRAYGIAVDGEGNSFVTGQFTTQAVFEGGTGGPVTLTSSNGDADLFLAKYDGEGNLLWAVKAGGQGDYGVTGYDAATDASGNCYVAGRFYGKAFSTSFVSSKGFWDGFVAKFGPSGALLWVKGAGGSGYDEAAGVAVDSSGNVAVTGSYSDSGDAVVAGTTLTSAGGYDVFVARYSAADGTGMWARGGGGTGEDMGLGVSADGLGNIYVTGMFSDAASFGGTNLASTGDTDGFVLRYDSDGNPAFAVSVGGDSGNGISTCDGGTVAVTGAFSGSITLDGRVWESEGGTDAFVAMVSGAGSIEGGFAGGGAGDDAGVAVASQDLLTVAVGLFRQGARLGERYVATHAGNEMFLAILGDVQPFGVPGDLSGNGRVGLEDAIGVLQVLTSSR